MTEGLTVSSESFDPEISYEQAYAQLEKIVSKLESGDVSLDDSVKLFQKGTELARYCAKRLASIEQQIAKMIVANDGTVSEVPLDSTDV